VDAKENEGYIQPKTKKIITRFQLVGIKWKRRPGATTTQDDNPKSTLLKYGARARDVRVISVNP